MESSWARTCAGTASRDRCPLDLEVSFCAFVLWSPSFAATAGRERVWEKYITVTIRTPGNEARRCSPRANRRVVASRPRLLRAMRRELLEQGMSIGSANSVRCVGLDESAGQRRSVQIQRKRERKCSKGVRIKMVQNGLKHEHETKCLFKMWILRALACGHAGWACAGVLCSTKVPWPPNRGETGDPSTWFLLNQLRTWLDLQGEDLEHSLRERIPDGAW